MSRSVNSLSRQELHQVAPAAESGVWWAEVADLRERIERRRESERVAERRAAAWSREGHAVAAAGAPRRTITITGRAAAPPAAVPLRLVEQTPAHAEPTREAATREELARPWGQVPGQRRRPRRTPAEWLGAKPDRIAAWAVALGFLLVLAGILSAH